jgi:hypothetical protein
MAWPQLEVDLSLALKDRQGMLLEEAPTFA